MPFKSKEQERYLQINEPEIYRDWVEKYGRFKGAESLPLNPMEVPNTISRYYMVFVDNKKIGSYLTVEEAQEVAESKNGEVIEYIADLTDAEREYMTKVNREFSQRQKTGEFFKDWWWKEESDRFSNADDPYLRYTTTFPEENDFFDENILGEDDRRSKWISDAYGISPQMARILDSSRVFGMYMSQRDSPATIKKYRERILDAIDDYTPQSEKEAQMLKVLRPHMATRGVKGPSPSFWTTYRGWSYPKPVLNYYFDDYYDYPVPFMGYDLDKDYLVEDYGAESFRSYKVAPDLSSYTKAELVSSIAGPQGTAAYDEVAYDPIAQSRLSAETATQRFKNYGNSLSGDTVCPACGDESWDEYSDGDEWRGYCGCGYDFDAGSALPNPLLTFYEMEALKEQGKLTSDQKEYLEWRITSTLSDLDSSSHNKKYIQDELVAHGWTLDRWGNAEPPEESVATLVGNAESINSFSPARLIILGASIGVALGLYNTRGE